MKRNSMGTLKVAKGKTMPVISGNRKHAQPEWGAVKHGDSVWVKESSIFGKHYNSLRMRAYANGFVVRSAKENGGRRVWFLIKKEEAKK